MISAIANTTARPRSLESSTPLPHSPPTDSDRYSDSSRVIALAPKPSTSSAFDQQRGVVPINKRDVAADYAWLDTFIRDHASALRRAHTTPQAASIVVDAASADPNDLVAFANRYDAATLERRARTIAALAGIPSSRVDTVAAGIVEGMSAMVVNTTLRGPMMRAYVGALATRNAGLELLAEDPVRARALRFRVAEHGLDALAEVGLPRSERLRDSNAIREAARFAMRQNDRLAHNLTRFMRGRLSSVVGLYALEPEFTRANISTYIVGLAPQDYPFPAAKADTLARAAILGEVRTRSLTSDDAAAQLRDAVRATRQAPPDYLQLLPR